MITQVFKLLVDVYKRQVLHTPALTPIQRGWFEKRLQRDGVSTAMRLNYYVGVALGGSEGDKYIAEAFKCIQSNVVEGAGEALVYNLSLIHI